MALVTLSRRGAAIPPTTVTGFLSRARCRSLDDLVQRLFVILHAASPGSSHGQAAGACGRVRAKARISEAVSHPPAGVAPTPNPHIRDTSLKPRRLVSCRRLGAALRRHRPRTGSSIATQLRYALACSNYIRIFHPVMTRETEFLCQAAMTGVSFGIRGRNYYLFMIREE
jgi:hypothetical protein